MPKIYRKVKKKKDNSGFLITLAVASAFALCFALQVKQSSKAPKPSKEVVLIEEVPLGEYSVLKQLPALKTGLECDSKCFKKKKREENNMTKEQRDKAFAELFNN